jgi:hypothetical protein
MCSLDEKCVLECVLLMKNVFCYNAVLCQMIDMGIMMHHHCM